MTWAWVAGGTLGLATLAFLYYLVRKGDKYDAEKQLNSELDSDLNSAVQAQHDQEKREADHEKRVEDIVVHGHIDRGAINELLENWPDSVPKAPAPGTPKD